MHDGPKGGSLASAIPFFVVCDQEAKQAYIHIIVEFVFGKNIHGVVGRLWLFFRVAI